VGSAYCGDGEEHDDELFDVEDGVADDGVDEADEAAAALFEEEGVGGDGVAVY